MGPHCSEFAPSRRTEYTGAFLLDWCFVNIDTIVGWLMMVSDYTKSWYWQCVHIHIAWCFCWLMMLVVMLLPDWWCCGWGMQGGCVTRQVLPCSINLDLQHQLGFAGLMSTLFILPWSHSTPLYLLNLSTWQSLLHQARCLGDYWHSTTTAFGNTTYCHRCLPI